MRWSASPGLSSCFSLIYPSVHSILEGHAAVSDQTRVLLTTLGIWERPLFASIAVSREPPNVNKDFGVFDSILAGNLCCSRLMVSTEGLGSFHSEFHSYNSFYFIFEINHNNILFSIQFTFVISKMSFSIFGKGFIQFQ